LCGIQTDVGNVERARNDSVKKTGKKRGKTKGIKDINKLGEDIGVKKF